MKVYSMACPIYNQYSFNRLYFTNIKIYFLKFAEHSYFYLSFWKRHLPLNIWYFREICVRDKRNEFSIVDDRLNNERVPL